MSTTNELMSPNPGVCVPVPSAANKGGEGEVDEGVTDACGVAPDAGMEA